MTVNNTEFLVLLILLLYIPYTDDFILELFQMEIKIAEFSNLIWNELNGIGMKNYNW